MGLTHRIVFCRHCITGLACVGKLPPNCPNCGLTANWSDTLEPRVPYELSRKDTILLKALHIDPEQPIPAS